MEEDDAQDRGGPAAVEAKLDGIRVQVHRADDAVTVFTRSLDEVTDRLPEVVEAVGERFGLPPLAVEDAVHAHQRPKVEAYGNSLFLAVHTAQLLDGHVRFGETHMFVGPRFLITVRHGASLTFALRKFKEQPGPRHGEVGVEVGRNPQGRLRALSMQARLRLGNPAESQLSRALGQFMDFCTVTQSVREAILVAVQVFDSHGVQLQ